MVVGFDKRLEDVSVVVLVADADFGRCPLASRYPAALWSVVGKPTLVRLLEGLAREGISEVSVCSVCDCDLLRDSVKVPAGMNVRFLQEELPVGNAGWLRRLDRELLGRTVVVLSGNLVLCPSIREALRVHEQGQADVTVFKNASDSGFEEIYLCDESVIDYVPEAGYCDIKENLIPRLLMFEKRVYQAISPSRISAFQNWMHTSELLR